VDKAVGTAYGAARPPDDDWAALPKRITFLIAPDQTIAKTYEVTDVAGHAAEVLEDIRAAS
jgi:peroxiredoxin